MIVVKHISKYFDKIKAVDDVSFEVKEGETLILLGTSGCGKTTILRMINRLIEPTKGTIYVNNKSIRQQTPEILRRGMGYVLQNHGLFPHYTVAENLAIVPKLLKWDNQRIIKRSYELLEKLDLPAKIYLSYYPDQLSGGQQQRVGLARALMADPPILLMDEPLGALDPVTRSDIRKDFNELDELKRKTIIMVTHDIQEAFELGNRICLMDKGKIKQIDTPSNLLFNPQNDFVVNFLNGQHLQLELKITKLAYLWQYLPLKTGSLKAEILTDNTNLWDAISSLSKSANSRIIIKNLDNNEYKSANLAELMGAYNQLNSLES